MSDEIIIVVMVRGSATAVFQAQHELERMLS